MNARRAWWIGCVAACVILLAACTAPATPTTAVKPATSAPQPTAAPKATEAPKPTAAPVATSAPAAQATAVPVPTSVLQYTQAPAATSVPAAPTATSIVEQRVVEVEWPPQMRLGDSDTVRLALMPFQDGYVVTTEFPEHQTVTSTVAVARPGGYDLTAVARLDGTGFDLAPQGEQVRGLPVNEMVTWRWSLTPRTGGQHRLSLTLLLRWTPQAGSALPARETQIYSRALTVQVMSLLGLTTAQAAALGVTGLVFGCTLSLPLAAYVLRPSRKLVHTLNPNPALVIEKPPALELSGAETTLLRALFHRYARLTIEAEFRSGYSGARTFLLLPVHADGRADAYTIAKIGARASIQREFENYETFVKDTLPPITARIQETPVVLPRAWRGTGEMAVLRYTFIGEAGRTPASLRQALCAQPDPALLEKLFATFGPNWWMQRKPHTFRLAEEYDRMLPAHYVLEPAQAKPARILDARTAPGSIALKVGEVVSLRNFQIVEHRPDGKSLSLAGRSLPGQPPLRLRWLSLASSAGAVGRVVATRETLLRDWVSGLDLFGLPDPLARLPVLLNERVMGTQSAIHGDLNLENVLIGPGGFVWLIDFAQTRDGHPLYDFAHLEAEIVAHVIAPQVTSAEAYLQSFDDPSHFPFQALLSALHTVAHRCLFNPAQPREYDLAVCLACLGALKFSNLDSHARHLLYLTAARLAQTL